MHLASFRGKQNFRKVQVFTLLQIAKRRGIHSLRAKQIKNNIPDLSNDYLLHRLTLWHRWRYLNRWDTEKGYSYGLSARGKRFLTIVPWWAVSRALDGIGRRT